MRIKKKNTNIARKKRYTAASADIHELYQESVQSADHSSDMLEEIYEEKHGRKPLSMREDFCGTGLISAHWVTTHPERTAVGLDLDQPTLDWGRARNIEHLGEAKERIRLLNCDVLSPDAPSDFDVIMAFNFSYCVFQDRLTMLKYFKRVRECLKDDGLFVLDLHGGPDSQFELEEETEQDGFTYVWEQGSFDPINSHTVNKIHFRFPDGSEIADAFVYDWRLWSLPELRDILKDAGFSEVVTWWDGEDDIVKPAETAVNYESYVAHLAAWK